MMTNENTGTVRRYYFNVKVSRMCSDGKRYTLVEAYAVEETSLQLAWCVVRTNALHDGGIPKIYKITPVGSVPV